MEECRSDEHHEQRYRIVREPLPGHIQCRQGGRVAIGGDNIPVPGKRQIELGNEEKQPNRGREDDEPPGGGCRKKMPASEPQREYNEDDCGRTEKGPNIEKVDKVERR